MLDESLEAMLERITREEKEKLARASLRLWTAAASLLLLGWLWQTMRGWGG